MEQSDYKELYDELLKSFEQHLSTLFDKKEPKSLYEPFRYLMTSGGKRIRPVLTLTSCALVSGDYIAALNSAAAIEILHNFTLAHDDIMDESPIRRGRATVHTKWNDAVAILTGDLMVGIAYSLLPSAKESSRCDAVFHTFNKGLVEVCEGQAYDMDFNDSNDVTEDDYKLMISKKTAAIIETAVLLGAYVGDASEEQANALKDYAHSLGMAFQLQDDLLDITADQTVLGKSIGQDFIEGKKTLLIIKARAKASTKEHKELMDKFYEKNGISKDEIPAMTQLMTELGIFDQINIEIDNYFKQAKQSLLQLPDNEFRDLLEWIISKLINRNY